MKSDVNELRYKKFWLFIGYLMTSVVIFLSVTSDPPEVNLGLEFQDKVLHCITYFILMFWFAQIYHEKKRRLGFALMFITMGIILEGIQSMDPSRQAEFNDMVANAVGVALAIVSTKGHLNSLLNGFEGRLISIVGMSRD